MKEIVLDHPFIKHKISILRDEKTCTKEFRELINELSMLVCYEAMRDIKLVKGTVKTPITVTDSYLIDDDSYVFVPILRAGLSMVEGVVRLIPNAKIGHIGLYRNEETLKPVRYYYKMPTNIKNKKVVLLDPMLATGGSAVDSISMLKEEGVKDICFLCIIAAPEGIEKIKRMHPDVEIYVANLDEHLNENGYIVPGLGDAGDRIFGTK